MHEHPHNKKEVASVRGRRVKNFDAEQPGQRFVGVCAGWLCAEKDKKAMREEKETSLRSDDQRLLQSRTLSRAYATARHQQPASTKQPKWLSGEPVRFSDEPAKA
jgi:hypothetical protein